MKFRIVETILTETHYDKVAIRNLASSGLFNQETSEMIVNALKDQDLTAMHGQGWMDKYLVGIVRMLTEYADGDMSKAERFLNECPRVFNRYFIDVIDTKRKNPEEEIKIRNEFVNQMSYQDVKDKVAKSNEEVAKANKEKKKTLKFDEHPRYKVVRIDSYDQMHKMYGGAATGNQTGDGSEWCHTNGQDTYDAWVNGGENIFFVIERYGWKNIKFDPESNMQSEGKDEYGNSLIAILVDAATHKLLNATLRCNHKGVDTSPDNQYMSYEDIDKVVGIDVEAQVDALHKKAVIQSIDKSAIKEATLLTLEQAYKIPEEYRKESSWWWLRYHGYGFACAACVNIDGYVCGYGPVVHLDGGVRPALYLKNPESLNLEIGDICEINRVYFLYVLPGVLLSKDIVGECPFRTKKHCIEMSDCKNDAWRKEQKPYNEYEGSDIEEYVKKWFEKL